MLTISERLTEMAGAAEAYCALIENHQYTNGRWLIDLCRVLPRLHSAVMALNVQDHNEAPGPDVDLDERFELYTRLRQVLGERDGYWLEFDESPDQLHMSGSLADDLTDIFFDLQYGLDLLEEAWPQRAAQVWKSTYRRHWGQHLVDAERHLYALKIRNLLNPG